MLRNPVQYFTDTYARYGSLSSWSPRNPRHLFAFGPDYNKEIFGAPDTFQVDAFRELRLPEDSAMARLTAGLLKLNGSAHRTHRQLMQPAFQARRIGRYHETMVGLTQQMLDGWREGDVRGIDKDVSRLTLLIAMRTVFDLHSSEDVDELNALITRLLKAGGSPATLAFPFSLPGTSYRTALRTAQQVEDRLREMISQRRSNAEERDDILSALISARDDQGAVLSDDELIGEAYTAFCHESSAASVTWTLFLLDRHPDVLADLTEELAEKLGGSPPTLEQLDQLPLLDRVLKESLRLFPPAAFGLRYASRDTSLGPYGIPAGATVFYSQYVSHRIPEVFDRPHHFAPDRWEGSKPSVYEYIPFGAGPHNCLGRAFAVMEMKIILAMLLQRFHPRVPAGSSINQHVRISLVIQGGINMRIDPPGRNPAVPVDGNIHNSVDLIS